MKGTGSRKELAGFFAARRKSLRLSVLAIPRGIALLAATPGAAREGSLAAGVRGRSGRMDFLRPARSLSASLVAGRGHYEAVVKAAMNAERSLWIATANLKELWVEEEGGHPGRRRARAGAATYQSILAVFEEQVRRGVEIRILHSTPPSRPFREELRRRPGLSARTGRFQLRLCPRQHSKLVIVDGALVYLGSGNWTGAGLGAKGEGKRNFELGILSRDDILLDETQAYFDSLWSGTPCRTCRMRSECPKPLSTQAG
jgi:phosphatidylserine/phosphatidylglycerophosphate/cardiolipin synthase-like enzyme